MTTMCLKYSPAVVACVCIDIICRWSGQEISGIDGKQWYEAVDPSVTKTMLDAISKEFLAVLEKFPNRIKRFINSESLCQGSRQSGTNGPRNLKSLDGSQRPGSSSRLNYSGYKHGTLLRGGEYNRDKERREREHRSRNPIPGQPSTSVAGSSQHNLKHDPSKMPPPTLAGFKSTQFIKREHSTSHYGTSDKYQKPYERSKRPLQDASLPPSKKLAKERPDFPPPDLKRDFKKEIKREVKKEVHEVKREHLPDPRREVQHHGDGGKPPVPEPPKVFPKEEPNPSFFLNNNSFNIMAPTEMPPDDIFDTEQMDADPFQEQTVHNKLKSPPRPQSKPTSKPQDAEVKRNPVTEVPPERLSHGNGVHQKPSSHKKEQRSSHSMGRHVDSTTPPLSSRSDNRPAPLTKDLFPPGAAQVSKNLFPSLGVAKSESVTLTKPRQDAVERLSEHKGLPQISIPTSAPKEKSSSHSSHHSKHKEKKKHKSKDRHKDSSKEHKKSKKRKKDKHKEKSRHKSPPKDDEGPLKMTFVRSEQGTYTPDKAPPNTSSVGKPSTSIPPPVSTPSLKIKIPKSRLPAENDMESSQLYSRDSLAPKVKLKIPKDRGDRDSRKRDRSPISNYHKQVHDRKSDFRH